MYGIIPKKGVDALIIKRRSVEYKHMGLAFLYDRLPKDHEKKTVIYSKMVSASVGISGEKKVERIFDKYNFPFKYSVLHDVNLSSNGKFQIDTLFLCQYFILILECKNIVGELSFEKNPLCLNRKLDNRKMDTFESPEVQVDRNKFLLKEWLSKRGIKIPVTGVIVLSNMKSKVVKPPNYTDVIYASTIPVYLRNMNREKEYLSVLQMNDLAKTIVESHQTYIPFPMCRNWGIDTSDLITGVKCEKCLRFGMVKKNSGWLCLVCGHLDRLGHVTAVREWFALVDDRISNKQCRRFLQIESSQLASRILNSICLSRELKAKNTIYRWKW